MGPGRSLRPPRANGRAYIQSSLRNTKYSLKALIIDWIARFARPLLCGLYTIDLAWVMPRRPHRAWKNSEEMMD